VVANLDRRGLCGSTFFLHAGWAYAGVLADKLNCVLPLSGLGVGQQLAWYGRQAMDKVLRVPALEFRQGGRALYSFAVDGRRLQEFAAVSRVGRAADGTAGVMGIGQCSGVVRVARPAIVADGCKNSELRHSIRSFICCDDCWRPTASLQFLPSPPAFRS
jgi:hypothetical protein